MKGVLKRITRKYYAYTNKWTQPVCTSNNSYGTFTGGGYFSEGGGDRAYFHVSDGQVPTSTIGSGGWDGTCWGTTHSSAGWFNWHFPEKLRIVGIDAQARNYAPYADYYIGNGFFKAGSDGVQIGDAFQCTSPGHRVTVANIPTDGIITQDLYFYKTGGDYSGLSEIFITAYTLQEITEAQYTPSSYSFITEHKEINLVKRNTQYFAINL